MNQFDAHALKRELQNLSATKRLAFGLLLCERMMPALRLFCRDTHYDIEFYETCLRFGWKSFDDGRARAECNKLADRCFEDAPDTEEFDHHLTSASLNAILSIGYLLKFVADRNSCNLVEIASLATDTIDLFVQRGAVGLAPILRHPLMKSELDRQQNDLEFLQLAPENGTRTLDNLLKERIQKGESLLPLS